MNSRKKRKTNSQR